MHRFFTETCYKITLKINTPHSEKAKCKSFMHYFYSITDLARFYFHMLTAV